MSDFTAVGDKTDGWIILPPANFIRGWAHAALEANAHDEPGENAALVIAGPSRCYI